MDRCFQRYLIPREIFWEAMVKDPWDLRRHRKGATPRIGPFVFGLPGASERVVLWISERLEGGIGQEILWVQRLICACSSPCDVDGLGSSAVFQIKLPKSAQNQHLCHRVQQGCMLL